MDAFNLHTASTYINNLLLARGLLRNGQSLELAKLATPSNAASEKNAQSTNAKITAQVINLVHDLILRRDVCFSVICCAEPTPYWIELTFRHSDSAIMIIMNPSRLPCARFGLSPKGPLPRPPDYKKGMMSSPGSSLPVNPPSAQHGPPQTQQIMQHARCEKMSQNTKLH